MDPAVGCLRTGFQLPPDHLCIQKDLAIVIAQILREESHFLLHSQPARSLGGPSIISKQLPSTNSNCNFCPAQCTWKDMQCCSPPFCQIITSTNHCQNLNSGSHNDEYFSVKHSALRNDSLTSLINGICLNDRTWPHKLD